MVKGETLERVDRFTYLTVW